MAFDFWFYFRTFRNCEESSKEILANVRNVDLSHNDVDNDPSLKGNPEGQRIKEVDQVTAVP